MTAPRILNFGSINIDHVYRVPHFAAPGETLASTGYERSAGGKGFNQSIALARAGASVSHAGAVGADGRWLVERLSAEGVNATRVRIVPAPTGHAVIQVTPDGENAIVLCPGANHAFAAGDIRPLLEDFGSNDHFLCQNETLGVAEALRLARAQELTVWFNPAPITGALSAVDWTAVDWLVVNETEAVALAGTEEEEEVMFRALQTRCPRARIVITLGAAGAVALDGKERWRAEAPSVTAVDSTGAGDIFVGYLIAAVTGGRGIRAALERACAAAALSVQRRGAADSAPYARELSALP